METINNILKYNINTSSITKPSIRSEVEDWQKSNFKWASKYVYGIDLDYRLTKAAKISCFLNGDGKANIIHANGLAPFYSQEYIGKLHGQLDNQDNQNFDILIANPPYAVKEFGKHALTDGAKCFSLYQYFFASIFSISSLYKS